MRRNGLITLLLAIILTVSVFATGNQEEVESSDSITIQLGISPREVGAALPELLESFEAANPEITVEWNKVPGVPNDQHTLYVTNMIAQSEQPDVMALDVVWPGEFIANGWAEPLNDYFSDDEFSMYLDGMMNSVTLDGDVYGIPLYTNAIHFFYRKDLLDKYGKEKPETWEELIETAMYITEKEQNPDLNGYISMWAQIEGLFMNYLQFMWGAGGQFFDANGMPDVDSPEAVKALQTMVDMIYKYEVAPESILTYKPNDAMALFRQGRSVFMIVQDFVWPMLNEDDSPVKGKVVMDRVPYFEGNSDSSTVCMGGWILTVNPYSEHKAEAADLIRHLTSTESGKVLAIKAGAMPAVKGMESNSELLSAYPIAETLYKDFSVGNVRPSAQAGKNYPELSHIMQMEIHAALLREKTASDAMSDAQKALDALLK
jgi:trehalose/maltose transport system substrate-binding protein